MRKHKISFDEAKLVFNDPLLVTFADDFHFNSEDRLISIGNSASNRILLVVIYRAQRNGEGNNCQNYQLP